MTTQSMMKIDIPEQSICRGSTTCWDDNNKRDIETIFVYYGDDVVDAVQFMYYDHQNGNSVLSERHGYHSSGSFIAVKLDWPTESITCLRGYRGFCSRVDDDVKFVTSITFETNKAKYGPFGKAIHGKSDTPFSHNFGDACSFAGFHGRFFRGYLEGIGVYVEPKMQHKTGVSLRRVKGGN